MVRIFKRGKFGDFFRKNRNIVTKYSLLFLFFHILAKFGTGQNDTPIHFAKPVIIWIHVLCFSAWAKFVKLSATSLWKRKEKKAKKKKRIRNLEIIDFIVHYKDSKLQLWGKTIGVVKLKMSSPSFSVRLWAQANILSLHWPINCKTFLLYWLLLQSIFIPVHFIDILYTFFSQRIKLYSSLDPFFKLERKRKKDTFSCFLPLKKEEAWYVQLWKNIENVLRKY